MADKTIGDLTQAASIGNEDLFVLQQNSEAKKLKGAQLVQYAQDAVGAQVTAATQAAENAEAAKTGAESAQTQAQAARDAILNMIVEAITLESGLPATVEKSLVDSVYKLTFGLPRGEKGATGATGPANTLAIGTVTKGTEAAATITGSAPNQTLNLVLPKGDKGDKGATGETGATGNGISSISLKSGTHAAGTTDTYEITFTDGTTFDFLVYNGADGAGKVKTVNGQEPDENGNIEVSVEDEIFIAEYGVTAIADVVAAYNAGKAVFCRNGNFLYTIAISSSSMCSFVRFLGTRIEFAVVTKLGGWSTQQHDAIFTDMDATMTAALTLSGGIILPSSTEGSAKKFKLTVDDSGTITATEVTT